MMKTFKTIGWAVGCLLAFTSCVKENLDPCPDRGNLSVKIYAEKFLVSPPYGPESLESRIGDRITRLDWYLYKDETLYDKGSFDEISSSADSSILFAKQQLPYGSYTLVLTGNLPSEQTSVGPDGFFLTYPGSEKTDDYFTAVVPMTVDCNCTRSYTAVMQRVHGVIRFVFENLPERADRIETTLDNLSGRMSVSGRYDTPISETRSFGAAQIRETAGTTIVGAFPTIDGSRTNWTVRLYEEGAQTPFLEKTAEEDFALERNRLVELAVDFSGMENAHFTVTVDPEWNGVIDGGEAGI